MKKIAIVLILTIIAGLAQDVCPENCVQRDLYCDCPSNPFTILTNCTEDFMCPVGYVCDTNTGQCILIGGFVQTSTSTPEFSWVWLVLAFIITSGAYIIKNKIINSIM